MWVYTIYIFYRLLYKTFYDLCHVWKVYYMYLARTVMCPRHDFSHKMLYIITYNYITIMYFQLE